MPTAFVTGASGFIGGAILRLLLDRGWTVRALLRNGSAVRDDCEGAFDRIEGDIFESTKLRSGMRGVDVVFHVAARYSLWNPEPEEIYRDNVEGTRSVLEAALAESVPRVVHTSTVGVLRLPADGRPANEECQASLDEIRGHYKRSKWLAEECASSFVARGLPVVIVNPSTPIGAYDLKPTPTGRIILDFLERRMIGYTSTGLNVVAVEDVAAGHLLAAEKGRIGQRYILGGDNLTLKAFLGKLERHSGIRAPKLYFPRGILVPLGYLLEGVSRLTGRPPLVSLESARMAQRHMYYDTTKARDGLGLVPRDIDGAIDRAVAWFRARGATGGPGAFLPSKAVDS